jgi:hypothetical protein
MPVRLPNSFDRPNIKYRDDHGKMLYVLEKLKTIEKKINILLGRREFDTFDNEPYSENFLEFWKRTNKKGNKRDAYMAYKILTEKYNQTVEDINLAYDQMADEKKLNHIQFWPSIDRFLSHYYEGYLSRAKDNKKKWGEGEYLRTGLIKKDKCL